MQPNYPKLKTNLRLCIQRLKLLEKKKTENALKARKEIADYISLGKPDRARIKVESIIREDYLVEAFELVEMFCDLLIARFGLIQQEKNLDDGLAEAISSLIWVAPRLQSDVSELKVISDLFAIKYGKQYAMACKDNATGTVSPKLQAKLSVQAPPKALVENYMIEIAKKYSVPFEPDQQILKEAEEWREAREACEQAHDAGSALIPGQPLIDFGATGGGIIGIVPGTAMPQPGFNVMSAGFVPPPDLPAPINPEKPPIDEVSASWPSVSQPTAPHSVINDSPPPKYDSVVSNSVPTPAPRTFKPSPKSEGADFLDLPEVPDDSPEHKGGNGGGTGEKDNVDFDDLAKRFEALKKRK